MWPLSSSMLFGYAYNPYGPQLRKKPALTNKRTTYRPLGMP